MGLIFVFLRENTNIIMKHHPKQANQRPPAANPQSKLEQIGKY